MANDKRTLHMRIKEDVWQAVKRAAEEDDMPTATSWIVRTIKQRLREDGFLNYDETR